jgi:hypothetical protein
MFRQANIYIREGSLLYALVLSIILYSACKPDSRRIEVERVVSEWIGKTVEFPSDVSCFRLFKDMVCVDVADVTTPYKLLLYVDSAGCTSCQLKLFLWRNIMVEADTLFPGMLSFLFYFQPKKGKEKELLLLLKRDKFAHSIFFDREDKLNSINRFPKKTEFQCFLLDSSNRVISIGNPTLNPKIWELYKEVIADKKAAPQEKQTTAEVEKTEHAFGEVKIGESSYAVFRLKNTGEHPLIIISDVYTANKHH